MSDTDANTPGTVPLSPLLFMQLSSKNACSGERCHNCEQPATLRHGLPVADDGTTYVASGDTTTEWGGVPACEQCAAMYVAAGDRCNEVLAAYKKASQQLRYTLDIARGYVRRLARLTSEAASAIRADG